MNTVLATIQYQSSGVTEFWIALGGIIVSIAASLFAAGRLTGGIEQRVTSLENQQAKLATKEDISALSEKLAEIRGMFRLQLREDDK